MTGVAILPDRSPAAQIGVEPDFDFAGAAYRAFFAASGATAFQAPDWLAPFYRRLVLPPEAESCVVVGRDGGGALRLVVPLLRRRSADVVALEYAFLGVTDYACPVLARDFDPRGRDRALCAGFPAALGPHDSLSIEPVRAEDAAIWRALLALPGDTLGYGAHAVGCNGDYPGWRLCVLGHRRIAAIERKARRLGERGDLRLEILGGPEAAAAMGDARRFRHGRFRDDPLQVDRFHAFYAEVAERGAASGLARTYRLSCGGETVGVLFGLIQGDRFCYLVLGCDYLRFGAFSPGMILFDRAMAHWFSGGGRVFDFTIGDEAFKAELGAERTPMLRFRLPGDSPGVKAAGASA